LYNPLDSVNIKTKKPAKAEIIRSDICVVPSAAVIAEAMLAICLANEFKIKFGGDSMKEILQNYKNFLKLQKRF
jgi:chorismate synthase